MSMYDQWVNGNMTLIELARQKNSDKEKIVRNFLSFNCEDELPKDALDTLKKIRKDDKEYAKEIKKRYK